MGYVGLWFPHSLVLSLWAILVVTVLLNTTLPYVPVQYEFYNEKLYVSHES